MDQKIQKTVLFLVRLLTATLLISGPTTVLADHHEYGEAGPGLMEVYECNLLGNATLDDVKAFGQGPFAKFAEDLGNQVRTFLWTPVAIAPPYQEASFRWVNHYPSWAAYDAGNAAWNSEAASALQKELFSMAACELPGFHVRHAVLPTRVERPARLLIGRCHIEPDYTLNDVKKYISRSRSEAVSEAAGVSRGQMLITPAIGIDVSFDFLNILYGQRQDIAKLLDGVLNGVVPNAMRSFDDMAQPHQCGIWDLHDSHAIFASANQL